MAQWRDNLEAGLRTVAIARGLGRLRRATDEVAREQARAHLADLMGREHGLAAKIGQLLSEGESGQVFEACRDSQDALTKEDFLAELESAWGRPADEVIDELDDEVRSASIGQLRRARLKDGRQVAIKLRHPGIDLAMKAELRLLGLLPRVGPARRWGLDLGGLKEVLNRRLLDELDYRGELERQENYRLELCADERIVVPRAYAELSTENVLVQDWEPGQTIETAARHFSPQARKQLGRTLLGHFFHRFFRLGLVHADPHGGNLSMRLRKDASPEIVLYDFGALAAYPRERSLAFLRLILAARERTEDSAGSALVAAGFDARKLGQLSTSITELARILVEPFTSAYPFATANWRPGPRLRGLLGEESWWFRSAGPPEFLNVMRAMDGLVKQLGILDARLDWFEELHAIVPDLLDEAARMKLPDFTVRATFAGLAQRLRVRVVEGGLEKVAVAMPVRVLEDLEAFMDEEVVLRLKERGIEPQVVADAARRGGLVPGLLFSEDVDGRQISLALE